MSIAWKASRIYDHPTRVEIRFSASNRPSTSSTAAFCAAMLPYTLSSTYRRTPSSTRSQDSPQVNRAIACGTSELRFLYDALGNRVVKEYVPGRRREIYVRDAQGNLLAVYEAVGESLFTKEYYLYGVQLSILDKQGGLLQFGTEVFTGQRVVEKGRKEPTYTINGREYCEMREGYGKYNEGIWYMGHKGSDFGVKLYTRGGRMGMLSQDKIHDMLKNPRFESKSPFGVGAMVGMSPNLHKNQK